MNYFLEYKNVFYFTYVITIPHGLHPSVHIYIFLMCLSHVIILQPEGLPFFFILIFLLLISFWWIILSFVCLKSLYFVFCFERYFHWVRNSKLSFFFSVILRCCFTVLLFVLFLPGSLLTCSFLFFCNMSFLQLLSRLFFSSSLVLRWIMMCFGVGFLIFLVLLIFGSVNL